MSLTEDLRRAGYVRPAGPVALTGTCAALAAGSGLDRAVVRLLVVLATVVTGGWLVVPYLVGAVMLPRAELTVPQPWAGEAPPTV